MQLKKNKEAGQQGSGIRRLFRHSAVYSISTSVQRLQGLILTPIYTSSLYLPQLSQYGNYGLIYTFIAFMNFVYLYGMDSAFLRYFFMGNRDRKTVFSGTFQMLFLSGILTSLILIIFARQISGILLFTPELALYVRLAAFILFFDTIGNLPFLILRAEEKAVTFTIFRMIRFFMELALNILFVVVLKKGVPGILYANITASVVNLILMLPFTLKYFQFKIDYKLLREMLLFGLPFLPNGIAYMTIEMVDRFLVTDYLGKDLLAIYHANYKFASVLLFLIVGFRNAWQPFFLKIAEESRAGETYARVLNYFLFLGGMLTIFITFFIKNILTTHFFGAFYLLGEKYWGGIPMIAWIVLSYFFYGIYVIFTPAFYIKKKSKYMIVFTGSGAIVNVGVNIALIPVLGLWGAVTATVFAYLTMMLTIFVFSQKLYPIPLDGKKILIILLSVGVSFFMYYIIKLNVSWRVIVFLILFIINFLHVFSAADRDAVLRIIRGRLFKR